VAHFIGSLAFTLKIYLISQAGKYKNGVRKGTTMLQQQYQQRMGYNGRLSDITHMSAARLGDWRSDDWCWAD